MRCPQTYNDLTTLNNECRRQRRPQQAVYKITHAVIARPLTLVKTSRNLNTRLIEHKRATTNGDLNNNINIDWDSTGTLNLLYQLLPVPHT